MLSFASSGDSAAVAENQAGLIIVPLEERRIVKEWRWRRREEKKRGERRRNFSSFWCRNVKYFSFLVLLTLRTLHIHLIHYSRPMK